MIKYPFTAVLGVFLSFSVLWAADEPELLKPAALGVNTDKDEDEPHVSSDGLTLYYTVTSGGQSALWAAERKKTTQPWSAGKLVEDINSKGNDTRGSFLTPEGKYPQQLFFASNRDPFKAGQKGGGYDLYFSLKQTAQADWGPANAIVPIGTEEDELHPWLTSDGLQLYFSRKAKDGWHQFLSRKPPDGGQFGAPVEVGLPVNFHHATLPADGKTMYVQGPLAEKDGKVVRWGLFRCTLQGKNWSKPEALAALNGTESSSLSPNLSRDGVTLYFASDRAGGKGGLDLYSIPTAQLKKK